MSRKVTRRKFMAGTAAGAALATFKFPMPAIAQRRAVQARPAHRQDRRLAEGGIQMEQGVLVWLKEHGNKMAGRPVEFFSADTGGKPAGTKTKAQELIERDKVDVILGPLAAFELLAIDDYIKQAQDADAQPRRRRRSHPAPAQPLLPAGIGNLLAGDACDGPLRRQGNGQEEAPSPSIGISLSATNRKAASRRRSRRTAAV